MTLGPDADQTLFKDTLRRYLSARSPLTRVRETMLSDSPFDSEVWLGLVEMGVPGMAIPEEFGGAGGGFFELGIVAEELGRALAPVPFLSTVVLAAGAISLVGTPEQKKQLLPEIAAGERLATVALTDGNAGPAAVEETGDRFVLNGSKSFVLDGQVADTVIVAAAGPQATVELLIVDADMKGIEWSGLSTMDLTRPQAEVSFDAVRLPETARLGSPGSGRETVTELLDQAATALAFEQVGGAERCLEMSVEYAKDRRQFGRAIGSFQAIKHKCADMLVQVEAARSVAYAAGRALDDGEAEAPIVTALAKAYCSEAYFAVAAETIQVHGGIGFTWEHDAHLYFKRAETDRLLFGAPAAWRSTLGDRLGL